MTNPNGTLLAEDERFHHQVTDTFATVGTSDPSWTEKVCAMAMARDGSLQIGFGLVIVALLSAVILRFVRNETIDQVADPELPEDAVAADVDIFSPCALGGSINENTIDRLQAKIVAGAANNQLRTPDMDAALHQRGVLYAPDYVINGAGVISVGLEITGQWTNEEMTARIDNLGDTLTEIFKRAEEEGRPTGAVADELALEIIARGAKAT